MKLGDLLDFEAKSYPIFPQLITRIGLKETVFLCRLIWWQQGVDEWVSKSIAEIESQTGLSGDEQRAVRVNLKRLGLIEDEHDRLGHSLRFRIRKEGLETELSTTGNGGHIGKSNEGGQVGNSKVAHGKFQGGTLEKSTSHIGKTKKDKEKKADASLPSQELRLEGEEKKEVPEELNTKEFLERWEAFKAHRKELKKPFSQEAQRLMLLDLKKWGLLGAIQSINDAIKNGWRGVFEPKEQKSIQVPVKATVIQTYKRPDESLYIHYGAEQEGPAEKRARELGIHIG